jgi:hypothetical protein
VRGGFRYRFRALRVERIYTRGLKLKSLKDIRAVLDNFERVVTRAIARVPKHVATGGLIAVAPPRISFASAANTHAPEGADTS